MVGGETRSLFIRTTSGLGLQPREGVVSQTRQKGSGKAWEKHIAGISTQRAALILHGNLNTDCEIDHFAHWVLFKLGFSVLSPEVTGGLISSSDAFLADYRNDSSWITTGNRRLQHSCLSMSKQPFCSLTPGASTGAAEHHDVLPVSKKP